MKISINWTAMCSEYLEIIASCDCTITALTTINVHDITILDIETT